MPSAFQSSVLPLKPKTPTSVEIKTGLLVTDEKRLRMENPYTTAVVFTILTDVKRTEERLVSYIL